MITRHAIAVALAATSLTAIPATADAATGTQIYSGTGWKISTHRGVYSLSKRPMVIKFASTTARDKLTPYLKPVAAQLTTVTGTQFTVSTTVTPMPTGCAKLGEIVVSLTYRPTGEKGMCAAWPCYHTTDRSVHSARVLMDSEWLHKAWFSTNATTNSYRLKNALAHEIGHAVGLTHPNKDLNKDGVVASYECVKNTTGYRPLLCSPNGGNMNSKAGQFTTYDVNGLKQLVANYGLPAPQ